MQCKDIPDEPVLRFLAALPVIPGSPFGSQYPALWGSDHRYAVENAMPTLPSRKLALAKMRQLMNRGLVDGCPCGCRGDFTLTEAGKAFLANHAWVVSQFEAQYFQAHA